MDKNWWCVCVVEDLPTAQVCLLLVLQQAREWNGWGWLAPAWPHGTSWPAVILLRDECVSGSSSVLPSCGFGVLCGRSRKSKIAWGRFGDLYNTRNRRQRWDRVHKRGGEAIPYLKEPVSWGNRDLNVLRPLLTEASTALCGLAVPGHPPHLVDARSAAVVTWGCATGRYSLFHSVFIPTFQVLLQFSDKMFSDFGWKEISGCVVLVLNALSTTLLGLWRQLLVFPLRTDGQRWFRWCRIAVAHAEEGEISAILHKHVWKSPFQN